MSFLTRVLQQLRSWWSTSSPEGQLLTEYLTALLGAPVAVDLDDGGRVVGTLEAFEPGATLGDTTLLLVQVEVTRWTGAALADEQLLASLLLAGVAIRSVGLATHRCPRSIPGGADAEACDAPCPFCDALDAQVCALEMERMEDASLDQALADDRAKQRERDAGDPTQGILAFRPRTPTVEPDADDLSWCVAAGDATADTEDRE